MSAIVCERCGKTFTAKRNLVRHIKNVHEKREKFECDICKKSFSRIDNLQNHKNEIHLKKSTAQCEVCGKTVSNIRFLEKHKCPPLSSNVSQENQPSSSTIEEQHLPFKKRKSVYLSTDVSDDFQPQVEPPLKRKCLKIQRSKNKKNASKNQEYDESEKIEESDDEITQLMKNYFGSIRSFSKKGLIQSVFNFFLNDDFQNLVSKIHEVIMNSQFSRFKINYSLGYILKNV